MRFISSLISILLVAGAAGAQQVSSPAALAPPPVEAFFDNPQFSAAAISPSGKYVAARVSGNGARQRLAVFEVATGKVNVVAQFRDADVRNFQWVNDERLIYDSEDLQKADGKAFFAPGLFAVNRDGTEPRPLAHRNYRFVEETGIDRQLPWNTFMIPHTARRDSSFVYVQSVEFEGDHDFTIRHKRLIRLDTRTGRAINFIGPRTVKRWLLDYAGEPRLALASDEGTSTVLYRDPKRGNEWRPLAEFHRYLDSDDSFEPLGFGPDGTLYVNSSRGRDKSAVYTYDIETGKLGDQPVVQLEDYDFAGRLAFSPAGLQGFTVVADGLSTQWLDAKMQALQNTIDKLLPATINVVMPPSDPTVNNVVVAAYSDVQPLVYLVYNADTGKLIRLGDALPQIDSTKMSRRALVNYKARDGLSIPAWITLPHGGRKNLPMVVLVHGGPWVRGDTWAFNEEAQFLASRGYVVLQPEFRGSTGYGKALYQAGIKQWGLKMQDDIADGARWAIAQGYADPKRICIAGSSYGGYSTLMGLINDADLFRCGVNWAGVTDIELMYKGSWTLPSDMSDAWKKYGMPQLVGDPGKDAEQLKRTSPLLLAAKIKQPLLLAYGSSDLRVPLYHGKRFYDAVKPTNQKVEWIEYEHEGHGWALPENRFDFWKRVEKFLDQNIGASAKTE
ncbi:alpha/beta hydrolase family protein [Massilia endophytica]|uniref:alpha/beta hydrolase family protein n=1 Tax=Massilia endophytica TaxID=2899220 RepID=UPI001E286FE1|nr:prolyl oligopeptidase family serine peptidase [Massilia endophytica]UGQ45844.1 prolyl oligopeptidase family serine peptidase [Massilia endophytica]